MQEFQLFVALKYSVIIVARRNDRFDIMLLAGIIAITGVHIAAVIPTIVVRDKAVATAIAHNMLVVTVIPTIRATISNFH